MTDTIVIAPQTAQEAEELVKNFYQPHSASKTSQVEKTLQGIQRSADGWNFANYLLQSTDSNCKFFGALTFQVKLNNDTDHLSEPESEELLSVLLGWLLRAVDRGDSRVVVKKLCSALVTYFLRPISVWKNPLRHTICSFSQGQVVQQDTLDQHGITGDLLSNLSGAQRLACLWLDTDLVDETKKVKEDASTSRHHRRLRQNVPHSIALIQRAVAVVDANEPLAGLYAFQAWALYAERAHEREMTDALRRLIAPISVYLPRLVEAVDVFVELLQNYPAFFKDTHYNALSSILRSEWGQTCIADLRSDFPGPMSTQYALLLFAFGEAIVEKMVKALSDPNTQHLLSLMHEVVSSQTVQSEEYVTIGAAGLEFWNPFVEEILDFATGGEELSPEQQTIVDLGKGYTAQTTQQYLKLITLPAEDDLNDWDFDEWRDFNVFRQDVGDYLQICHFVLGNALPEQLVQLTLNSVHSREWSTVEMCLFCLDRMEEGSQVVGTWLEPILESPLYSTLATDPSTPIKTRRTAVQMLGDLASYLKHFRKHLPGILNFLFTCVEDPELSEPASKAILSIASECKRVLVKEVDIFLDQYARLSARPNFDTYARNKLIAAVAQLVQALPAGEPQDEKLLLLLDFVNQAVRKCLEELSAGQFENGQATGFDALHDLHSIGEAFQVTTIDLDDEQQGPSILDSPKHEAIMQGIVKPIRIVSEALPNDGDILDQVLAVLRTGYNEKSPSPFTLPPIVTVQIIQRTTPGTPRFEKVLDTMCAMLNAYSSANIEHEAQALLQHLLQTIQHIGLPSTDPGIAQACEDVLAVYIKKHTNILFQQPSNIVEGVLNFTLLCLRGADPLPKRKAAALWTDILTLTVTSGHLGQEASKAIVAHFGPSLCDAIIWQVTGDAMRSELDHISDAVKKLVTTQPKTREWLATAMSRPEFPSNRVDAADKDEFMSRLLLARGGKGTNDIVKNFWGKCRGLPMQQRPAFGGAREGSGSF